MKIPCILILCLIQWILEVHTQEINVTPIPTDSNKFELETPNITVTPKPAIRNHNDINATPRKNEILDLILGPPYSKTVRPMGAKGSGPIVVAVNVRLRSVENLDDVNMEYTVQMNYRQDWIDPRLAFEHIEQNVNYLQLVDYDRVWVPDVFFANEKSGSKHKLMVPNVFARIYPDGKVETSARVTLLLACQMDLHIYPLDKQKCSITMASYGWTVEDLIVKWRDITAVEVVSGIRMARFSLISYLNGTCESFKFSTGEFSCIVLHLQFEREFGYYLVQIYIPCIMLVMVSWVSFWLEPLAAEARISLCVTTILTVVTQAYGINQTVPPASYVKAIDVWTFAIQFMVFAAILQFSYVNYVARFEWKSHLKNQYIANEELGGRIERLKAQGERKAKRVDNISKITFPVVFAIFNLIYWLVYLKGYDTDTSGYTPYKP